jgi:DHA1 family bicyclomycin/chloramphenicol resistance-like MFS transporter
LFQKSVCIFEVQLVALPFYFHVVITDFEIMSANKTPITVVLALALTMMLAPLSVDTYLPAFPNMSKDFGVSIQLVSLTVAFYVFSLALSQLLGGGLSDRFGRRNILLLGLLVFTVASLFVAASNSLTTMLIGQVVQAFGAGWAMVSVPALVRDHASGKDAAKLFSMMGFIMVLAPGIAPSIGSLFLGFGSWRNIFVFIAIYAGLMIPLAYFVIFRQMPNIKGKSLEVGMFRRYCDVFNITQSRPYILWQAASFSVMMLFITNASFIYQEHFKQSEQVFSLLFGANIVMMLVFNLMNRYLITYFDSHRILKWSTIAQAIGVVFLIIATIFHWRLALFLPAMMLAIGAMGAISPCTQSCYLEYFPQSSGSAAALLGAAQFGIAGLISAASTCLPNSLFSVVIAMAVCSGVSCVVMIRFHSKDPAQLKAPAADAPRS